MNLGAETAAAMVAVEQAKSEGERHRAEAAVAVAREQTKQRKAAAAQAQREADQIQRQQQAREAEERTRQEQEATQRAREETQRAREATVQSGHRLWRVVASCVTVGGGIIGCAITSSAAASISVMVVGVLSVAVGGSYAVEAYGKAKESKRLASPGDKTDEPKRLGG